MRGPQRWPGIASLSLRGFTPRGRHCWQCTSVPWTWCRGWPGWSLPGRAVQLGRECSAPADPMLRGGGYTPYSWGIPTRRSPVETGLVTWVATCAPSDTSYWWPVPGTECQDRPYLHLCNVGALHLAATTVWEENNYCDPLTNERPVLWPADQWETCIVTCWPMRDLYCDPLTNERPVLCTYPSRFPPLWARTSGKTWYWRRLW